MTTGTQRTIRVTALTAGTYDPSSRFRIRQFVAPLRTLGIAVSEYFPVINRYRTERLPLLAMALRMPGLLASRFSDVVWLGRELASGRYSLEHLAGRKRFFDVDDAIWTPYPSDFSAEIVRHCNGVIAGNRFLAEHYRKLGSQVSIVPTSVDTDVWKPARATGDRPWTLGWLGSWANIQYLQAIEEPLAAFLSRHSDSRLLVVCNRRPPFKRLPAASWEFAPWSMENEVPLVQQMDVGLMPLSDSELSRGKCGFKMLAYMSTELPVVVSPVGVNAEILGHGEIGLAASSMDDWEQALRRLHEDRKLGAQMGAAGRAVVEERYSVKTNAKKLADIFRQAVDG